MGKAGSKVLREASVDGIQAQVQAASSHSQTCKQKHTHTYTYTQTYAEPQLRHTHTKSVQPLKKVFNRYSAWANVCMCARLSPLRRSETAAVLSRYDRVMQPGSATASFHTSTAHLHFSRLHHRTSNRGKLLPSCGQTVNSW